MEQMTAQAETVAELGVRLRNAQAMVRNLLDELDDIRDEAARMTGEDGDWNWDEPEEDYYTALDIRDSADVAANALELAKIAGERLHHALD